MASALTRNSIELEDRTVPRRWSPPPANSGETQENTEEFQTSSQYLAQSDSGTAAWRLLLAAFVFESLLWGKNKRFFNYSLKYSCSPFNSFAYKMAKVFRSPSESSKIITLSFLNLPITLIYPSLGQSHRESPIWALLL
jgi:hypothetical protein